MWITFGIAATRIGAVWVTNIVARRTLQTGTIIFVALAVLRSQKQRKEINEAYNMSREGQRQDATVVKNQSNEVPF